MIDVTYYRGFNRVTVKGHAEAAPKGEDLICSACSNLVHTLDANVNHLVGIGAAGSQIIDISDGNAEISCKANHKYKALVLTTFETVCVGFEILASKFPEYVTYEIMG